MDSGVSRIPKPISGRRSTLAPAISERSSLQANLPDLPRDQLYQIHWDQVQKIRARIGHDTASSKRILAIPPPPPIVYSNTLIARENDLKRILDQDYASLCKQKHALDEKNTDLYQNISRLKRQNSAARTAVEGKRIEFDNALLAARKSIANAKAMVEIQLDEIVEKFEVEYNELEAQLEAQVQQAQEFRDSEQEAKQRELKQQLEKLTKEVTLIKQDCDKQLADARQELDSKLNRFEQEKNQEVDNVSFEFEKCEQVLCEARERNHELEQDIRAREHKVGALKDTIVALENRISSHASLRQALSADLELVSGMMGGAQIENTKASEDYTKAEARYCVVNAKSDELDMHRRLLENSIMDLQGLARVYVRGPVSEQITTKFNKVLCNNTCDDELLAKEYCFLAANCMNGTKVSIIYAGLDQLPLAQIQFVFRFLLGNDSKKLWEIQSFAISGKDAIDTVDKNKTNKSIFSEHDFLLDTALLQRIALTPNHEEEEVKIFLMGEQSKKDLNYRVSAFMLCPRSEDDHGTSGSIMFANVRHSQDLWSFAATQAPHEEEEGDDDILKLARYCRHSTSCLFIADTHDTADEEVVNALVKIRDK